MKKATEELKKITGVSITERRGMFRVKLGSKVTGGAPLDKLVATELIACELVNYWLHHKKNRSQAAVTLTDRQLEDALFAIELLENKTPLTLTEICRKYVDSLPSSKAITVKNLGELFAIVRRKQKRSKSYLDSLVYFSRPLNAAMGDRLVHEIQSYEIEDYMDESHATKAWKTYNNHLGYIKAMWALALKKGHITEDASLAVDLMDKSDLDIGILTPDQLLVLIQQAQKDDIELVIPLALQAFAGLRRAEMARLTWGDIDGDWVVVSGSASKNKARRTIPILPPLKSLLRDFKGMNKESLIYTAQVNNLQRRRARLAKQAGIKTWPHNALRHSWVSYRLADIKDDSQVALEAGHSTVMLHRHYKGLVRANEAQKYFELFVDKDI